MLEVLKREVENQQLKVKGDDAGDAGGDAGDAGGDEAET